MKISQTEGEHEARTLVPCCHQMRIADPTKVSFHLSKGQRRIEKRPTCMRADLHRCQAREGRSGREAQFVLTTSSSSCAQSLILRTLCEVARGRRTSPSRLRE